MIMLIEKLRKACEVVEADNRLWGEAESVYLKAIQTLLRELEATQSCLIGCAQCQLHDHIADHWCVRTFQIKATITTQVRDIKTGVHIGTYDEHAATIEEAHLFVCNTYDQF